jgi:hypothetical protein
MKGNPEIDASFGRPTIVELLRLSVQTTELTQDQSHQYSAYNKAA